MSDPKSVVVLGEALADVFPSHEVIGGAPFNVARNLAALGAAPLMITRIGSDALGERIAAEYDRFGMNRAGLQVDAERPTGVVKVHMQGTDHRFEICEDQAWDRIDAEQALKQALDAHPAIVYFGTLAQRSPLSREAVRSVVGAADLASGPLRFLDLNLREGPDNKALSEASLGLAQMVKVNDDELDQLIDWFILPGQPALPWGHPTQRDAVRQLMRRFAIERLVVTRGADGWACFEGADGECLEGASPSVTVKDTVGAGDAFASVLLLGQLNGWPLRATLERAAAFAGRVCAIAGAVSDDLGFYKLD